MPFPIAGSGRSMEREKPKLLESGKVKGFLEVLEYAKTGGEYMKHRGEAGTPSYQCHSILPVLLSGLG